MLYAVFFCLLPLVARGLEISFVIPEEKDANFEVGRISTNPGFTIRDSSGNIPREIRFALLNPSSYFKIHQNFSRITTTQRIDREEVCQDSQNQECRLTIDVIVTPIQYFQLVKVHVLIEDINDNSPSFPYQIHDLLIPESAPVNTTLPLPSAEDRDSVVYGVSYYELEGTTQAFLINTQSNQYGQEVQLVLRRPIDREIQGSYTLKLVARDGGQPSRSGMMLLNVTVGDENDNSPIFEQLLYNVRVPESAHSGIMLTRLTARDRDSGENGRITYSLSPRSSNTVKRAFRVDPNTGELLLNGAKGYKPLDFESSTNFLIPVIASDSGVIPRSSQAMVNVTVADENDNSPVITVTTVSEKAQVLEHLPNGTFVAHILVVDGDGGSNGQVTCVLSSPYFTLKSSYPNEYNLVVNAVLDREEKTEHNVTIWCSDAGSPPRINQTSLMVHIVDVNDQIPMFDRFVYYTMPIPENNPIGLPITQVRAIDHDVAVNAEIQYQLGNDVDAKHFTMNRVSGLISASVRFDREKQREYTFSVLAIDRGEPALTATATVYIRIADVNDNRPTFNKTHYRMEIAENLPKYSFVGKVTATDLDEGSYGDIWYRMVNASSGPFIIAHDTGIVSTRAPLDREKIGGSEYQVSIVATDYGMPALSSEVKLTITVLDENDNSPVILNEANSTFKCSYQAPKEAVFGQIKAVDLDVGENGDIGFFIHTGNQYKLFSIDRHKGFLTVATSIDISMVGFYRLSIGVHDNGQPPHTVFTSIFIHVTQDEYIPLSLVGLNDEAEMEPQKHNVNLIVVVVLSSMSGVLSLILIIAIIRIKRQKYLQKKENHSYNCRTEAQKLFHSSRSSESSRPSCGSSWAAMSSTDRSSVFSRDSTVSTNPDHQQGQNFMTTFCSSGNHQVMTALQTYDKSNLQKDPEKCPKNNLVQKLASKEPDSDSGNCDDVSVHNSTPMLDQLGKRPNAHQPFQYHFLSEAESKPSSISSGNNSITHSSGTNSSSAVCARTNNSVQSKSLPVNHSHENTSSNENPVSSAVEYTRAAADRTLYALSDCEDRDVSNCSADQSINGEKLCERIDEMFFSDVV